ncbi:MAG: NAD(P)/FAD-dependent oxidoreductase [Parasphingorhabdus sp.]|uniref:FAD-dependent oxidoreductase n=1 Tax=Parasphingorhabdus sp. TaxID=2709688 RepID=UPI00329998F6
MTVSTKQVIISGGGPSGLAAALLFAEQGWQEILVIERRASPTDFEKSKAFNYQIDPRGQKLLKRLGIAEMLEDFGVANRGFTLTTIKPDGSVNEASPPIIDPDRQTSYWTTRRNLLTMLHQVIQTRKDSRIKLLYGHDFQSITSDADGNPKITILDSNTEKTLTFQPELLLACDGLSSQVRKSLDNWPDLAKDQFEMIRYPSASTGLTYKVLNLPACFPIAGSDAAVDNHRMTYSIPSQFKDRRDAMAMFAFPVTDPNHPRSVNIIREADHNLWTIESADNLISYLQEGFPQLDIASIISREEAEDFASLTAGQFPAPQYAKSIHATLGEGKHAINCLLIGDAAHAFPPDLGLGVNSALEDLFVLDGIMSEDKSNLSEACVKFQKVRLPANASLARLVQTVAPYQYNHKPWHFRKWILTFVIQNGLHKTMPWLIDKPTFILTQNPDLDFVEIERRQKQSKTILNMLGCIVLGAIAAAILMLWL